MESGMLINWKEEREELRQEVSRLQDELAESCAEREELESRALALTERLSQSLGVSLDPSLRMEEEEGRRKRRESREREARQALLIHKLQNKVLEYRDRCQGMEQLVKHEERELLKRERRVREEHSSSLESALIRLEEEQQRSVGLAELNSMLRDQLGQSGQVNESIREDLRKLTVDWSRAVEEAGLREMEWQKEKEHLTSHIKLEHSRLMSIWGGVVILKRHCHTIKTATDRDLWELRAEFSRLTSSLLIHCPHPVPRSTSVPPQSSTLGPLSLQDLKPVLRDGGQGEMDLMELRVLHEAERQQLNHRISELSISLQVQEEERERLEMERREERERDLEKDREREGTWERERDTERCLESVCQAVVKLSRALGSQSLHPQSSSPSSHWEVPALSTQGRAPLDLPTMLTVLAQAESTLQWRHQEVQEAAAGVRRLGEERAAREQTIRYLEAEIKELQTQRIHEGQEFRNTQDTLLSEREIVASLMIQLGEEQRRSEERRKENERLKQEREREEERRDELERDRQRSLAAELVESAQSIEREARTRMELHGLQGALQREQLDRERAEEEAADAKGALSKARESVLTLSSDQTLLKRELSESRETLEKMAALNESQAKDKRELNARALKMEMELADLQTQTQGLESEVMTLHRELKNQSNETTELRTREKELLREVETLRETKEREVSTLKEEHSSLCVELLGVQAELSRGTAQWTEEDRDREELLRQNQRLEGKLLSLETEREELLQDMQELRAITMSQQSLLSQVQQQLSGQEVERGQLQLQVSTLLQTKGVLQGEIHCMQGEMERGMRQREQEKREEQEERERTQREREVCRSDLERLQNEVVQMAEQRRNEGEEREEERMEWQRERMAFSSELGNRDGEVVAMKNRMEGLEKENEEMSCLLEKRDVDLESLQTKLTSEHRSYEHRQRELKEEAERWRERAEVGEKWRERAEEERWRERAEEAEREMDRLNQRLSDVEKKDSEQVKAVKGEKDDLAGQLKKELSERRKKDQEIEELKTTLISLEEERASLEVKIDELIQRLKEREQTLSEQLTYTQRELEKEEELRRTTEEELTDLRARLVPLKESREILLEELHGMERLKGNLVALEEENAKLREREREKREEEENRRKKTDMEEKERAERLKGQLGRKDAEIQEIQNRMEGLEKENEEMSSLLEKRDVDLESLQTKLTSEHRSHEHRQRELNEKAERWRERAEVGEKWRERAEEERWRERAEEAEREMDRLNQRLSDVEKKDSEQVKAVKGEKDDLAGQLKKELSERRKKDQEIEELKTMLISLEEERASLEVELRKVQLREERMIATERENSHLREEQEAQLIKREEGRRSREQQLRAQLELRGGEVEVLRVQLSLMEEEKDQGKRDQRKLEEKMEVLRVQLSMMEEESNQGKRDQRKLEEKMEGLMSLLSKRDKEVEKLWGDLREKEGELERLHLEGEEAGAQLKTFKDRLHLTESALEMERRVRKEEQRLAKEARERKRAQDAEENNKTLEEEVKKWRVREQEGVREVGRLTQLLKDREEEVEDLRARSAETGGENERQKEDLKKGLLERERIKETLRRSEEEREWLGAQLREEQAEGERLRSRLEEAKKGLLQEDQGGQAQRLGAQVKALQEERDLLLAEVRKKEREAGSLKDETYGERREKEKTIKSLRRREEELKEVRESREMLALSLATLREQVAEVTRSRERSKKEVLEKEDDNQKMREGLKTAMQEVATLNELLEESHKEGERLRSLLQERKEELLRSRGESVRTARGEVDEMRGRTRAVEQENMEVERKLRTREEELEEALREKKRLGGKQVELKEALREKERKQEEMDEALREKERKQEELDEALREKERKQEELDEALREKERKQEELDEALGEKEWKPEELDEALREKEQDTLRPGAMVTDMLRPKERELDRVTENTFSGEKDMFKLQGLVQDRRRDTEKMDGERMLREIGVQKRGGGGRQGDPGNEAWLKNEVEAALMRERVASLLLDKEESIRMLKQREVEVNILTEEREERDRLLNQMEAEVYTLRESLEELGKDRERIRASLEKTEASLIGYRDRAYQQEKTKGAASETRPSQVGDQDLSNQPGHSTAESVWSHGVQERLSVLQRTVARLELDESQLQRKNTHLQQRCDKLKTDKKQLRELLKQVEQERGTLHHQLSESTTYRPQDSRGLETEELEDLRNQVKKLEDQLRYLRLTLALDHQERAEFIERSSRNNQWLASLHEDLADSLSVVSQQPIPSVLESETHRLDRSVREEELRLC